jgi:hypothetical protein
MDAAKEIKKTSVRSYPKISLTGNFIIYAMIFTAALIFTQALRSKASNIFFTFVFFLPWVMFAYTVSAKSMLKVYLLSDSATIQKFDLYSYQLRVINESILPYPFIDAQLRLPQSNSVRCIDRSVRIAMSPLASYTVKNTVSFRFRGTYDIGVDCLYVYDFFRMIRIRVDISVYDSVSVLPRRLYLKPGETRAISDSAKDTKKDPNSYEKVEISDIREYKSGDPLKSIHWNLSSKSEEFMVRDYDTGSSKKTYIFCDLSARFPDEPPVKVTSDEPKNKNKKLKKSELVSAETITDVKASADGVTTYATDNADIRQVADTDVDARAKAHAAAGDRQKKHKKSAKAARENKLEIADAPVTKKAAVDVHELANDRFYDDMNEFCADGVVELTVAAVLREMRENNECTLFWFDRRSETGVYYFTLRGMEDFNTVYRLFATAPLCPAEDNIARLSAMVSDTQDVKQLYVTSAIDADAVRKFCSMPSVAEGSSFGASGIILYNPEERFAHVNDRKLYIEGCRAQLASKGLKLAEGRLD